MKELKNFNYDTLKRLHS